MSSGDKRVMRHDLLTRRTQTVACYPRPEYWRVELCIAGYCEGRLVTDTTTLAPEVRVRASQMAALVIAEWRTAAKRMSQITQATYTLYRISPARHRELVNQELVRVLRSGVAA